MKLVQKVCLLFLVVCMSSCISTKSTIMNIDNSVPKPQIKENHFVITEYATDSKYGYHPDYPINLGFDHEKVASRNIPLYLNALTGPHGEKIEFKKIENCCPFPTKKSVMGAGTLEVYEITFEGIDTKIMLYFDIFEKGKILCPKGFDIKK
ncbi:2-dehydro-3-deoxyphosphooctonate aldolase [Flavobacterium aciduliphilum]|uniref:2-dehydro-3-deoxyphosphooctonate aldolase n=1 Tax=Flavobacterium aciduliphilum TaxID=1101402 RepID=A0A328YC58_9FLAO|nr:2-dehydro-3-deoxyphosphooctonate aldolase [Flavobacterium aciduliphilum]RAR70115.1 hypothetical protein CLV55_11227 [Flavobacterium aciduliphilum]